ncbi:hypothetical protein [Paenibacillus anseongense]|uniref:hypothetical protein n=1 Tax=Paenibacillus TaxID=44249 RepID=UPI002DB7507B|nr:hypothetical protein [Paenibacillus anseongense]MEC0265301.1 hypothetical protein [Paenibacillus anseongense]
MKEEDVKQRIKDYQQAEGVKSLTCGNNSSHEKLYPKVLEQGLVLLCPNCNYTQTYIPDLFFDDGFYDWLRGMKSLI